MVQIQLPSSKSIANRLMIIASLIGKPLPRLEGECEDVADMRRCILSGLEEGECRVKESGTALRFLVAYFAVGRTPGETTVIRCSGRLAQRPLDGLLQALKEMGMPGPRVEMKDGEKSIYITSAQLHGGTMQISSEFTSQFISAVLLISPYLSTPLFLKGNFDGLLYVRMTFEMMKNCGVRINKNEEGVEVANEGYLHFPYTDTVEADWSAAAFFYEYIALNGGEIFLKNLSEKNSLQGDSVWVPRLFFDLGVSTDTSDGGVEIAARQRDLIYSRYNLASCPDAAIPYVMTCCFCGVSFRLRGMASLRHKESDRIEALKTAMRQMGYLLEDEEDGGNIVLKWNGRRCEALPEGSMIEDFSDHRIAMAIECLGRGWKAKHPECVVKSFPEFYEELEKLKRKT